MGGRWVLLWVQGWGFTNYLWPQSRGKYVWDSTFYSVCHSPRTHSKWEVSGLVSPVCLTAGLRMWIIATPKLKHADNLCQSISHYSTTPMLQSGTCSTFLPQGATLTDIINTEMDQVSLTWHLLQRLCHCSTSEATLTRANSSKLCLIWSFGAAERRDETKNIKCGAQSWQHKGDS